MDKKEELEKFKQESLVEVGEDTTLSELQGKASCDCLFQRTLCHS